MTSSGTDIAVMVIGHDYVVTDVNDVFLSSMGMQREDVIGRSCHQISHGYATPCEHNGHQCFLKTVFATRRPMHSHHEHVHPDGSKHHVNLVWSPLIDAHGDVTNVMQFMWDETAYHEAHDALLRSEERFRGVVESTNDWLWETDRNGLCTYASPNVLNVIGYAPSELLGKRAYDFMPPGEAERSSGVLAEIAASTKPFRGLEYTVRHKDGRLVMLESSGAPYYDADGVLAGYRGLDRDITGRKREEQQRQRLEEERQNIRKLESLGVLAGGIAHDFNNILMAILGNADLASRELPPGSTLHAYMTDIIIAARRAAALSQQMLAYSGRGRFVVETINLSDVIGDMRHMLEATVNKPGFLAYSLAKPLPAMEGDRFQIQQMLINLISNAAEAIDGRPGTITISTGVMYGDHAYLSRTCINDHLPEGDYIYVDVADTGIGMTAEVKEKVFDPFFSTKFAGRGLGMPAVLGIVRGHRGAISVDSSPGKGTTVRALFPVSTRKADTMPAESETTAWHPSGTILVVDDEESVRILAQRMLERIGFTVIAAASGREALDAYRVHCQDIACVLLDLTMQDIDGEATFKKLRSINPNIRVVMSSGYAENDVLQRFEGQHLSGFIHKPYQLSNLEATLKSVLGA